MSSYYIQTVRADHVRLTSGDRAARHIQAMIFDGTLPPGSWIPQDEICEELGISRVPLREGLVALEREGWVTLEYHRGAFVNTLDEAALFDHYEMIGAVYGFAAQRALRRAGKSVLQELTSIRDLLAQEADPGAAGTLLRRFHQAVVDASRSQRTMVLLRAIPSLIPGDIFTTLPQVVDVERRAVDAIVAAGAAGDGTAAADAYATMFREVGEEVAALFRDRHLFDTVAVE